MTWVIFPTRVCVAVDIDVSGIQFAVFGMVIASAELEVSDV